MNNDEEMPLQDFDSDWRFLTIILIYLNNKIIKY